MHSLKNIIKIVIELSSIKFQYVLFLYFRRLKHYCELFKIVGHANEIESVIDSMYTAAPRLQDYRALL